MIDLLNLNSILQNNNIILLFLATKNVGQYSKGIINYNYFNLNIKIENLSQLWEESQAENGKLRQDMTAMRMELEATKQQLENAFQVKLNKHYKLMMLTGRMKRKFKKFVWLG